MGKHAQVVMGPAGSGKSTYVNIMRMHCENLKRTVHCVNLDPAAEDFKYPVTVDIKELITVDDVMEELDYGPNGGLVFAMEFLMQNIEWFKEQLGDYDDDYLFIDCPGQIELYTHMDIIHSFLQCLQQELNYSVCAVYLLDSNFITDTSKYISGTLMCLSAMLRLEVPHINIMSKMDVIAKQNDDLQEFEDMERFVNPDISILVADLDRSTHKKFHKLNSAISNLIEEYSMVSFLPLDITNEDNINLILSNIDNAMQYGEDVDINPPNDSFFVSDDENEDDGEND